MTANATRSEMRRHPVARAMVSGWRALTDGTSGRDTLVACSGGADSVALALALGLDAARERAGHRVTLGHIVHDMRAPELALADRDLVERLAAWLRVPFVERAVSINPAQNAEASARALRYAALAEMASGAGTAFVATAHHADDQLETLLMAIARGSGPSGMRGIHPSRALADGVTLIRPGLKVSRAEIEGFLRAFSVEWAEDHTNLATDRLRASIRREVVPALASIRPDAPGHASRTADLMRDAAGLVDERTRAVFGDGDEWERASLVDETDLVIGAGLRRAFGRLTHGDGLDSLSGEMAEAVIRAVRDGAGGERIFQWPRGVRVIVSAQWVRMGLETSR